MSITLGNAREALALRNELNAALTYAEVRAINWRVITETAAPALTRGWTGTELAKWIIGDLSETTENPGGVAVTTLRELGTMDPPREVTPTPPPIAEVLHTIHSRNQAVDNPSEWAQRIRAELHPKAQ